MTVHTEDTFQEQYNKNKKIQSAKIILNSKQAAI